MSDQRTDQDQEGQRDQQWVHCLACVQGYRAAMMAEGVDPTRVPPPRPAVTWAPMGVQVPGGLMAVVVPHCLDHLPDLSAPGSGLLLG